MVVFHRKKRSRDSGDLYIWISNSHILDLLGLLWRPDQRGFLTVFRLLALSTCLPWMHTLMHTKHSFDTKQFQSPFSVAPLQGALPAPSTSPRHVPGWWYREGVGRLWDTSKRIIQRILSHKSCSTSTFSKTVPYALAHNKSFCPPSCSALHPEHRKGYGEEEGATVLHMKHRIKRISQDVDRVKEGEALLKVKEHLTLPLKTSLRLLSKANKLHSFFFS